MGLASFQAQFLGALLASFLAALAIVAAINVHYHRQVANEHARELALQALQRTEGAVADVAQVAAGQARLLHDRLVHTPGPLEPGALLAAQTPAFLARPELSFVGLARAGNGEYAMLERIDGDRIRLRHFAVGPDGTRTILDRWVGPGGRLGPAASSAWNGYDPRTRPFYLSAQAAGRPTWTDTYLFFENAERPAAIGVTYALPWFEADGTLAGVIDADFDTRALSQFLAGLQREFPVQSFLVERRRDGGRRVVAHSDFVRSPALRESDLAGDELAREFLKRLPAAPPAAGAAQTLELEVHGESYVAAYGMLAGGERPDWLAVVLLPRRVAAAALGRIQKIALAALGFATLAGFVLAGVVARRATRPLARLAQEVGQADAGTRLAEGGPAEVALLARRFNELSDRIGARQRELAAAERAAQAQAARLTRMNAALQRAAQVVAELERDEKGCIQQLTRLCCEALEVTRAAMWICEDDGAIVRLVAMFDAPTGNFLEGLSLRPGDYPGYWATLQRERRIVTLDAAADPRTAPLHADRMAHLGRVALLDVAVRSPERILGVFSFHLLNGERAWTAEDEILTLAVADLLALVLERSRRIGAEQGLQARALRLAEQTSALAEITDLLNTGRDLEPSLRRVNELATRALGSARSSVWLIDEAADVVRQVDVFDAARGEHWPGFTVARGKYPAILARLAALRCVVVPDVSTDPDYSDYYREHMAGRGRVSVLHSALRTHGKIVGLVAFRAQDPARAWTAEDEFFAAAVADILSLQLETSARRAAENQILRRSERLARLSRAIGQAAGSADVRSGRLEQAFAELTEVCVEGMQATRAGIWTMDPAGTQLQLFDLFERSTREHSRGAALQVAGHERYFAALREGRFVAAGNARTDPRTRELLDAYLIPQGLFAMFDAPIRSRGEFVGVLCVEQAGEPRNWTEEEEIFCGAIADLAALALETAARQRAETEIANSRERLRLHIEGTPLGAIDWNQDLRVIGWNPAAMKIFGYPPADVIGRDGFFLVPEGDRPRLAEISQRLLTGRLNSVERFENVRADGTRIRCDWRNTALTDGAGHVIGITSLVEDVTERVRAEEEIRTLNASLEHRVAERTAALAAANAKLQELDRLKSEFLATMSHELRTPLNSIIGFTGILKQGLAGPVNDEQRKQLEMVYSSSRHLLGLINDILDLSRIEAGRLQVETRDFDPAGVLREVAESLGPMARLKNLTVVIDDGLDGATLRSDRKRFWQMVMNLANNAVKFTERGGVRLAISGDPERIWVRVTDTGPGIPPEHVDRLFEAFRQVDGSARRVYEGTGLGLYLCRKLVRLLGGEIGVETDFGRGSTFWFWVPRIWIPSAAASRSPFGPR